MKWIGIIGSTIGSILGITKEQKEAKNKLKLVALESKIKIAEAQTEAKVNRIMSNTTSDNQLDLMAKEQQKSSIKDEIVSFIFLTPLVVVTIIPFVVAYQTGNWLGLIDEFVKSYGSLSKLPTFFVVGIVLVVIDILGFRSFLRKAFTLWLDKMMVKSGLISKVSDSLNK